MFIHNSNKSFNSFLFVNRFIIKLIGPRQANLVLIAYARAKVQASLRIRAVSPEPPLLAHTGS